jgi:hypothetical protein
MKQVLVVAIFVEKVLCSENNEGVIVSTKFLCIFCRCIWEDNMKMDFQEAGGGHGDWMELAQYRDRWRVLVGTARDFRVP